MKRIIGIDQSTQGTKALLFDERGDLLKRSDLPHRQMINDQGWVSHDAEEIYRNTVQTVKNLIAESGIDKNEIAGIGISNQRETSVLWDKTTGRAMDLAVVWQCARAKEISERPQIRALSETIRERTGIHLSPYFPASKIAWLLENVPEAGKKAARHEVCHGTIDSWLIYKMTGGKEYRTDYSNASRTQLFNINTLQWDDEICAAFGIDPENLPKVCASDSLFGETTLDGYFDRPVPIHGVLGDSHGALLGQGCVRPGMAKSTYGTGSSIMMNIGKKPVLSTNGVVTSLAWGRENSVDYVLEGNINYTGAVISWLKNDVKLIGSAGETEELARKAIKNDRLYLVPAFTGLGAPYWDSRCEGTLRGITRTSGKNEIVRAGLECIAYQIKDIVKAMGSDTGVPINMLRVDGGPTRNSYLMQFQSDILNIPVLAANTEELSGIGAAYAAGMGLGIYNDSVFDRISRKEYRPQMDEMIRQEKYEGWKEAVSSILTDR